MSFIYFKLFLVQTFNKIVQYFYFEEKWGTQRKKIWFYHEK